MSNDFATAGRILSSIRRSESAAKSAEVAAWRRHQERCEKLLSGVSPVVRKLIETHREAEREQDSTAATGSEELATREDADLDSAASYATGSNGATPSQPVAAGASEAEAAGNYGAEREMTDAERDDHIDGLEGIAPSLLKETEPMTGVVVIDRSAGGKR